MNLKQSLQFASLVISIIALLNVAFINSTTNGNPSSIVVAQQYFIFGSCLITIWISLKTQCSFLEQCLFGYRASVFSLVINVICVFTGFIVISLGELPIFPSACYCEREIFCCNFSTLIIPIISMVIMQLASVANVVMSVFLVLVFKRDLITYRLLSETPSVSLL